jgi:hypothetical protein
MIGHLTLAITPALFVKSCCAPKRLFLEKSLGIPLTNPDIDVSTVAPVTSVTKQAGILTILLVEKEVPFHSAQ